MKSRTITRTGFILFLIANTCCAKGCAEDLTTSRSQIAEPNLVKTVLKRLSWQTGELKSYQGRIEYLFSQPLFESQTLRKGLLYYEKSDGQSKLRINFQMLKQDEEKEREYIEHYIFDGVWLTHIDYQIKGIKCYQQAEPNRPVNAFELAKSSFPIIGFTKAEELEKEFEIKSAEKQKPKAADFIRLILKPRRGSVYKDDYTSIEFWICRKLYLPAKIVAISTEEDIYEIRLIEPKINEAIEKEIFELKIPEGFGKPEVILLEK